MNIQVFGSSKSFDTKKVERYFKERRIKYQYIDMKKYGISEGELRSIVQKVGLDNLADEKNEEYQIFRYLANPADKFYKLLDNQGLIKTPIVRNGKDAVVGFCPEVFEKWINT